MNLNNIICFKQGNNANMWWCCTQNEINHINILINTILKKPENKKIHKIQFINNKNETVVVGGFLDLTKEKCSSNAELNDKTAISLDDFNITIKSIY